MFIVDLARMVPAVIVLPDDINMSPAEGSAAIAEAVVLLAAAGIVLLADMKDKLSNKVFCHF